jgi:hypothetical protein
MKRDKAMAFPLAAITTGLSGLGAIEGLIGGSSAVRRAQEAQAAAMREMEFNNNQSESQQLGSNLRGISAMTGRLNDSLQSGGRSLGSALAAAGVYNSSATAGALANQAASNNQTLGEYSTNLSDALARLHSQNANQISGLKFNLAGQQLAQAQQQQAQGAGGLASFLGQLGQFNLSQKGGDIQNKAKQTDVQAPSVLTLGQTPSVNSIFSPEVMNPAFKSMTFTSPSQRGWGPGPLTLTNANNYRLGPLTLTNAKTYGF